MTLKIKQKNLQKNNKNDKIWKKKNNTFLKKIQKKF